MINEIFRDIGIAILGIVVAPFAYAALKVAELSRWFVAKLVGDKG